MQSNLDVLRRLPRRNRSLCIVVTGRRLINTGILTTSARHPLHAAATHVPQQFMPSQQSHLLVLSAVQSVVFRCWVPFPGPPTPHYGESRFSCLFRVAFLGDSAFVRRDHLLRLVPTPPWRLYNRGRPEAVRVARPAITLTRPRRLLTHMRPYKTSFALSALGSPLLPHVHFPQH